MANKVVRAIGIGVGVLVGLAGLAAGGVYAASESRITKRYDIDPGSVPVPSDPASIERGRHLALAIGKCVDCHGNDMGGKTFIPDPKGIGLFAGVNLTSGKGGVGKALTDKDWLRAIRHGIGHDGRPLPFMPSDEYAQMTDQDAGSLIAYMKSVAPVDRESTPSEVGPVGRVLLVAHKLPLYSCETIDHHAAHAASVAAKVSAEYGQYLANTGGCTGCHGPGLSGGQVPGTPPNDPNFPPAANLTPSGKFGKWSKNDFFKALRTGVRPDGTTINEFMPWKLAGQMTDDEMTSVWMYLQKVPPKETGNR